MPTYEYQCTSCRHRFEEFQSIIAEPLTRCPKCGRKVKRLIGGGLGIIFKGSGFYTTDYKRSSASTGGNGSPAKSSEKKSDSESGSKDSSGKTEGSPSSN